MGSAVVQINTSSRRQAAHECNEGLKNGAARPPASFCRAVGVIRASLGPSRGLRGDRVGGVGVIRASVGLCRNYGHA